MIFLDIICFQGVVLAKLKHTKISELSKFIKFAIFYLFGNCIIQYFSLTIFLAFQLFGGYFWLQFGLFLNVVTRK